MNMPGFPESSGEASNDDDDYCPSSPGSMCNEDTNSMTAISEDEVTAQLAASGPVGIAAAAAIVSAKKRKLQHSFETNPAIRKRVSNRLLRKLRKIVDEFTTRVGQQAVFIVAAPGINESYKVFGADPLDNVLKNLRTMVMEGLESALALQAPPPAEDDPSLFDLPPLIVDGIPTPVEDMTQSQLRKFIPLMLKYSTGRGKPGWGQESKRPPWWPAELPWANVRVDMRSKEEKQKVSWTQVLRQLVIDCYKYHGREGMLPVFTPEEEKYSSPVLQTVINPDGTISIVQIEPNNPNEDLATVQNSQIEIGTQGEAASSQNEQLIITSDSVNSVITVPVSESMYQTIMANIHNNGRICVKPIVLVANNIMETPEINNQIMIQGLGNDPPHLLQVLSLKDATELYDVKSEETIICNL